MLPIGSDFQQDFFSLFNFSARFQIDTALLEQGYRSLQAQVHPDKFAHLPESERRVSMQWSARVNEAYQTLRKPLDRARYLLALNGVDTQEESNTAMPADFLMQQMEWREALAESKQAKDVEALNGLEHHMLQAKHNLELELQRSLDDTRDFTTASGIVRKLKFLEKLAEEIDSAFDEIDA